MLRFGPIGWRTLGFVLLLLALEYGLRRAGFGHWVVQEQNAALGWRMLPDQDGWSRNLDVRERINSVSYYDALGREQVLGFRDREWEPPLLSPDGRYRRDPNVLRVAVVGNSMTYGSSVEVERIWPRLLEAPLAAELARRGDRRSALVMNFAVQGYVFEQMARVYEDVVRRWRPDVLIVPVVPHDVGPMPPALDDPDYGFRLWVVRTATYDWLRKRVIDRWLPKPPAPNAPALAEMRRVQELIPARAFTAEAAPYWETAARRMAVVRAQLEADGGQLLLVGLPTIHRVLDPALPTAGQYWQRWAEGRAGVVYCEPAPAFQRAMGPLLPGLRDAGLIQPSKGPQQIDPSLPHAQTSLFLLDDVGHYSALGHEVLAREVAAVLVPLALP
jgi:hypothetical protein